MPLSRRKHDGTESTLPPASKRVKTIKTTTASTKSTTITVLPARPATKKTTVRKPAQTTRARTAIVSFHNEAPKQRLQVFVFGEGGSGELGLGTKNATDVTAPRPNPNLTGVASISTGGMHGAAITQDGKILTWGINDQGTLGRDTMWDGGDASEDSDAESDSGLNPLEATPGPVPSEKFPAGTTFVQVVAGDSATFALTDDGYVWGWGTFRDSNGIYGFTLDPRTHKIIKEQKEPMLMPGLKKITSLSIGSDFILALDVNGAVYAWGTGQQDQLGRRIVERRRSDALMPGPVGFPKKSIKIVSIHAASNHAFAIDRDGDTWAWGLNNFGQTGVMDGAGEGGNATTGPRKILSLVGKNMKMLAGGSHHSIGVTTDGECLVWGRMDGGQLGLDFTKLPLDDPSKVVVERGKPRILLEPTPLPIQHCVLADAGPEHNIVLTAEGKAYAFGFNVNYQCGQGTSDDIPIAKLMNGKHIRERKLIWAGCGGQYSMVASSMEDEQPLTNGFHKLQLTSQ